MLREKSGIFIPENPQILNLQTAGNSDAFLDKWLRQSRGEIIPNTKLVLVLTAGMRRGGITTGILSGLRTHGFSPDGLQAIVGSSVGGTVAREYAGNNLDALEGLFADDRRPNKTTGELERVIFMPPTKPKFINFVNTEDLFRKEGAPEEVVKAAKPEIYVGLRDKGEKRFINLKEVEDSVDLVISSMTIQKITERRNRRVILNTTKEEIMGADPLHKDSELIKFAINELGATDIGVLFTSNPFERNLADIAFDYGVAILEHMHNREHMFRALYDLRHTDKSPEHFEKLFSGSGKVEMAGFYPQDMPINPSELDLALMSRVIKESKAFGDQQGMASAQRLYSR
jgi:hypothetical protein